MYRTLLSKCCICVAFVVYKQLSQLFQCSTEHTTNVVLLVQQQTVMSDNNSEFVVRVSIVLLLSVATPGALHAFVSLLQSFLRFVVFFNQNVYLCLITFNFDII